MFLYGVRKGFVDIVLRIVDLGYLIRRFVDIFYEVIVNEEDCYIYEGIEVEVFVGVNGKIIEKLSERINGRVLVEDFVYKGKKIVKRNIMIYKDLLDKIEELGIKKVKIRFFLICVLEKGVC